MKMLKKGVTSQSIDIWVEDSSSGVGAGLTGLVFNSAGLVAYYHRPGSASVAITLVTLAAITTAWASGGFKEVDATNMPGWYRLDVPDAVIASGVDRCYIGLKGATNMKPVPIEIMLTTFDPQDGVRLGITALPNANAEAAGGLYTRGSGAGQINQDTNGRVDSNVKAFAGTNAVLTSGVPDVNAKVMDAAVATQVSNAVWAAVLDTFNTAAAALTTTATAKQILSILLAYAVGRTSNVGNTFSTPDNASVRITGASGANVRTSISLTPST